MLTVSAAEFHRNVVRYQDEALKPPLSITCNGRDRLVVLAVEEHKRLKLRDRRVFRTEDLSPAELQAIAKSEMNPSHDHRDDEPK